MYDLYLSNTVLIKSRATAIRYGSIDFYGKVTVAPGNIMSNVFFFSNSALMKSRTSAIFETA